MEETTGLSKQQKKSMETKAKIFKAAKRILQRSGYETLSIKNICEEAGVSNGSFYHHFKTKDDLLSYYIEDQPSINPDLLDLPENAEDAKRTIIQVYLNYVSYCKELGVEFMAGYYDTKNQALNPVSRTERPYPIVTVPVSYTHLVPVLIWIGVFQMLAMIPGTSRSGATIVGALALGVSRTAAADFTFFLAIPAMAGFQE